MSRFVFIFEVENENLSKKMREELYNFLRFLNIQRLGPIISSSILRRFKKNEKKKSESISA